MSKGTYGPFALQSYPCNLCGSTESRALFKQQGLATGKSFDIVACSACAHIRTDPRIPDERLGELYDEAYYDGGGFDPLVNYNGPVSQWVRDENEGIIATVSDALDRPLAGARWLDVGCGTGTLLAAARAAGADVVGSDDSDAALAGCARNGVPTLSREDLDGLRGTFDVVSAVEVIEHVPDALDLVRYMASMVRPGGVVYVHTENWNVVKYLPGRPYVMPEGHIQYFTPQSMRRIFALCNVREVPAFNRSWFVWRRLPKSLKSLVPTAMLPTLQKALARLMPGYSPFPVGIRS